MTRELIEYYYRECARHQIHVNTGGVLPDFKSKEEVDEFICKTVAYLDKIMTTAQAKSLEK